MNTLEFALNVLYSKEHREELIERGIQTMREHFVIWDATTKTEDFV